MSAAGADLAGFAITVDLMDFAHPEEPFPMGPIFVILRSLVDCKWRSRMDFTRADVKIQPG